MVNADEILSADTSTPSVALQVIEGKDLASLDAKLQTQAHSLGFKAAPLALMTVTNEQGELTKVYIGKPGPGADVFALGSISSKLPEGTYHFEGQVESEELNALAWALELYKYDPFKLLDIRKTKLVVQDPQARAKAIAAANAMFLSRDLINAPPNLMGPDELETAARHLALAHNAQFTTVTGEVLQKNFPFIHIVGAASPRAPRLIEFIWGKQENPKVTLVGKGVCFDTGGLDIKPSSNMLLMKKDMGGAAAVLGLAQLMMQANLPIRLRVLIPAVENAISGAAFRPGDVFKTRKGLTVEIGNTDAEGRLILCEALAYADEEEPDLLVDMATLTGAARVALGPDLPPFFTSDEDLSAQLLKQGQIVNDPIYPLPLWQPYASMIESPIADLNNAGTGGFAGAITAALFLKRFVEKAKSYVHFDIFGWTPTAKPGRPKGGEAQAIRALFTVISERFSK